MNYKVHLGGENFVDVPLDELQRRRQERSLTGRELVWRPGMSNWQTLDSILDPKARPRGGRKTWLWVVIAVVVGVGLLTAISYAALRSLRSSGFLRFAQESTWGVEAASRPLAQSPHSTREADVRKIRKAFRIRHYVDAYDKQGRHDQRWDADARRYLQAWLNQNFDDTAPGAFSADVENLGRKLASDPACDDPVVLTAVAAGGVEYYDTVSRYERAVAAFTNSPYKAYPHFFATVMLAHQLANQPKRVASLDQSALRPCRECLRDGSVREEDQPDLAENLMNGGWGASFFYRHGSEICSIADDAGPSFRWLARVLEGANERSLAWRARGDGWANTVTAEGWQGFQDHLAKAHQAYSAAWDLHPEWPQAAAHMVEVVMGESGADEMRTWFDRATMAQIDYPAAWFELRWALRPRWHGSLEAMRALGVAAIDSGRFDSDVPRQFFYIVQDLESEANILPGQHIYGRADIWPEMRRMYEGYIGVSPKTPDASSWREYYAVVAYFAGHYDVARTQLEQVGWHMSPSTLQGWGADISLLPLEVAARTGSHARAVAQAEDELG
jgi:hypothetical protein